MTTQTRTHSATLYAQKQDLFASKVVARLTLGAEDLPHDISERLRVARLHAVAQRKKSQTQVQVQTQLASTPFIQRVGSTAIFGLGGDGGDDRFNLLGRIASFLPLLALLVGLIAVNSVLDDDRANELAEVDSALLIDDLPPAAYVDPGFAHFLKVTQDLAP